MHGVQALVSREPVDKEATRPLTDPHRSPVQALLCSATSERGKMGQVQGWSKLGTPFLGSEAVGSFSARRASPSTETVGSERCPAGERAKQEPNRPTGFW